MCKKLKSEEYRDDIIDLDSDKSVMSEISFEDEVDCSSFAKTVEEPNQNLIFEYSIEFEHFVHNAGIENLKQKVVVFQKGQSTPNKVFVIKGLDKSDTNDLTSTVKTDNEVPSENHFWSKPIDNHDESISVF